MTVAELIAKLSQLPQDLMVLGRGYETGFDPINSVEVIGVELVKDRDRWDGEYDTPWEVSDPTISAVVLRRRNSDDC